MAKYCTPTDRDNRYSTRVLPVLSLLVFLLAGGCGNSNQSQLSELSLESKGRSVPDFNPDSAYQFVQQQVDFGTREPGSEGHAQTKNYLRKKLVSFAGPGSVFSQQFTHIGYEGDTLELANIIAAFNLEASDRIMLCAHWDTRPRAEEAATEAGKNQPILGADDGGSGVAVLLELARNFEQNPPPIGVDIVLFDGEDYGKKDSLQHYFLGSRHWVENPPVPGYSPRFAILLDMVGAEDAVFPKERYSMQYAGPLVNQLWNLAAELGFEAYFINEPGSAIQDDHVVINEQTDIPTMNIIHHKRVEGSNSVQFPDHWHTQKDDMRNIDANTLDAVGSVLAELIYNRL